MLPKLPYDIGDRIELVEMPQDPYPIPPGSQGIVQDIQGLGDRWQVHVEWDDPKRWISLCVPPDVARKVD